MKNNNFEEEYKASKEIEARYDAAEIAEDEEGMETARKEMRKLVEGINAKELGYSATYRDYADARDRGNEYIDLNDAIWDEKVPETIERLRHFGIDHFTFSSTWSSAVQTAWLFTENGCSLEGLIQIHGTDPDDKIPAYVFSIQ